MTEDIKSIDIFQLSPTITDALCLVAAMLHYIPVPICRPFADEPQIAISQNHISRSRIETLAWICICTNFLYCKSADIALPIIESDICCGFKTRAVSKRQNAILRLIEF